MVTQEIKSLFLFVFVIFGRITVLIAQENSNDHMFPPAASAKAFIDFDSKGFIINGKRTFIVSAGIEYARVPRGLWHDRLLRLQRAGFNCVEIYTFWNFHQPEEGKFSFTGDSDLGLFLNEVHALGMYAIVRVGPYYCAEWENGGYPMWLRLKPGVSVREDNKPFENYVSKFFDKLLPIVFSHQVNKGGCVIMVQLENEHPDGWGTVMPNGYFNFLQNKAMSLGLQVPYFFSGLHHSSDPAGDAPSLDDPSRPNPWFSTEFWSIWYTQYSSGAEDAKLYERRTWKIIAHGGNGYNYYMAHGGSNFGYSNNNEDAASYDYGAAVGQAGDLRPIYYSFKKLAWFARSFSDILENSLDGSAEFRDFVTHTSVKVTARHSRSGDIVFLDNSSAEEKTIDFPGNGAENGIHFSAALQPGEIFPVLHNFKLTKDVSIEWSASRIFGTIRQGNTITIVIYGPAESVASILFKTRSPVAIRGNAGSLRSMQNKVILNETIKPGVPLENSFKCNGRKIRIVCIDNQVADRCWFINNKKDTYLVIGPSYVSDMVAEKSHSLKTEEPWAKINPYPVWIYDSAGYVMPKRSGVDVSHHPKVLQLQKWNEKDASIFAAVNYNDKPWKAAEYPLPMASGNNLEPEAWYRTNLQTHSAGVYTLQLSGAGRVTSFVDGNVTGKGDVGNGEMTFSFSKGQHQLAFFTAHDGRDKFAGYIGPIDSVDRKGLYGTVTLQKGGPSIHVLDGWKFVKASSVDDVNKNIPSDSLKEWKQYTIGEDAFSKHEGFGWFRTTIPKPPAGTVSIEIRFESTDENATVFINNKKIIHHDGWDRPFSVVVNNADTITTPLLLSVFIENYSNEGGIDKPVLADYIGPSVPVTGWRMSSGKGDTALMGPWKSVDTALQNRKPVFYRTTFMNNVTNVNDYPVWRVVTDGLGHGSVWVNGHNLGRYPEKIKVMGLYIPPCWMKSGSNSLLIYDEDGANPSKVSIQVEEAAGRTSQNWTF